MKSHTLLLYPLSNQLWWLQSNDFLAYSELSELCWLSVYQPILYFCSGTKYSEIHSVSGIALSEESELH